ncbi:hypothetical protein Mal64_27270 [Pseudobythopirellula maris]|uniref:Uncharacterized protein n=1 Tax=Pseudobythopirellula maris TaxID=2527991 RepID=A0A5C5ZIG3_9BACT|nr:hypothetical protein [Pseudobythopirellula maris]TWT87189.1 hypothetical protein Mal64_27270 [Pseudobythopirellula maris]
MNDADRERLRRLLASFDDDALTALANKGLVRRAHKDLDSGGVSHEEEEAAVSVHGDGWSVRMPPGGPAEATDDSRANGVTRHVLAATIHLRRHWLGQEEPAPGTAGTDVHQAPHDETAVAKRLRERLLAIPPERIERWAGRHALREAAAIVAAGGWTVAEAGSLKVRFEEQDVDTVLIEAPVRGGASALLGSILTTAPQTLKRKWAAAMVAAVWSDAGKQWAAGDTTPKRRRADAADARAVLASATRAIETLLEIGLAHPSGASVERLFTLSVSARANQLPRLARLMRAAADQLSLIHLRDAQGDPAELLTLLAHAHALAEAIGRAGDSAPAWLVGQARSEYSHTGDLELVGVGAYPWRTASGYEGVTVLFWDRRRERFFSGSDSRLADGPGRFSPAQAYRGEPVWRGGASPGEMSRSVFVLRGARWNDAGRLSSSSASRVEGVAPAAPDEIDYGAAGFERWEDLRRYARGAYPLGLRVVEPTRLLAVARPTEWGPRYFDETRQQFVWELVDSDGASLKLSCVWSEASADLIEFLEAVKPHREKLAAVVLRIVIDDDLLRFEPVSLLATEGHRVLNPAFDRKLIQSLQSKLLDRLREKFGRGRVSTVLEADGDELSFGGGAIDATPAIQRAFADVDRHLIHIAESGARAAALAREDELQRVTAALRRLGLDEMSDSVAALGDRPVSAAAVLYCEYLRNLHVSATRTLMV